MKKPEDNNIQHLLGGYASGTLTPEEQQRLFEAAMDDQQLFDALANEQALKEVLDDPASRGYLRTALAEQEEAPQKKGFAWWWTSAGVAAAAAALAVVMMVSVQKVTAPKQASEVAQQQEHEQQQQSATEAPREMAKNTPPAPAAAQPATPKKEAVKVFRLPEADEKLQAANENERPREVAVTAPPPALPVVATEAARDAEARKALNSTDAAPPPPPAADAAVVTPQASASILFLQPGAFGTNAAPKPAVSALGGALSRQPAARRPAPASPPGASGGGPVRDRAAVAEAQESRKESADKADALFMAAGNVANAGIRYRIFRRNSQGDFVETRLDTRFEDGDEIQLLLEKNSSGTLSILRETGPSRWARLPLASQTANEARTAPIRLERGTLHLGFLLSQGTNRDLAAAGPQPVVNQLTEVRGNAMYVVAPGLTKGTVASNLRIVVH